MTEPIETCGARREGWEAGPPIGSHRIPCVRPAGHLELHRDGLGQEFPPTAREAYAARILHETSCPACSAAPVACEQGQELVTAHKAARERQRATA